MFTDHETLVDIEVVGIMIFLIAFFHYNLFSINVFSDWKICEKSKPGKVLVKTVKIEQKIAKV